MKINYTYTKTNILSRGNSYDYTFTAEDGKTYSDVANYPEDFTPEQVESSISLLASQIDYSLFK